MSTFEEAYTELKTRQKQAVDTIDGPLLVLAGPGTGKTQLLSARVANILLKTDTNPSNIVCLTFTVNAANNMRERLRSMIGPNANQVVIKTFHSLAADIISNNPEHFYAGAVRNPISDLAAQEIILSILDTLPHDNPLAVKFDDKYTHLGNILEAIGRAKDAGLSPAKLKALIDIHLQELERIEGNVVELFGKTLSHKSLQGLADDCHTLALGSSSTLVDSISRLLDQAIEQDLPTGKTTKTGELKKKLLATEDGQKVMAREHKANTWWQALVDVYEHYQAALYKRGYLDYADMLIGVIEVLESEEDLRLDIQESVQYLLVDEFQDSNEAQIRLMHLLVDNPHIEKPNIMVVGDPNQTIYGFNGAMLDNTSNFAQFYSKKGLQTVDLVENFRSSQTILDNASRIIAPYSDFRPELIAKKEPAHTKLDYTVYATEPDQAVQIRAAIQTIFAKDKKATVAILAREHKSLTYLAQYIMQGNLTVNYEQSLDIRTTACNELIITTLSLIQAIIGGDRTASNYQLSRLLRHHALDIDPTTTWQLALQANRTNNWVELAGKNQATASVLEWVHQLVAIATTESLPVLIEQLLSLEFAPGKTLYKELYDGKSAEELIIEAQSTRQLIELAKQYAQTDHVDLPSFLTMIRDTSGKLFRFSPSTGHYQHAVTLMSIHGAKGLEFDHVFIIDTDEASWKTRSSRYPVPLSLPIHVSLDTPADFARLIYVAATRAKQTLHISYVKRIDAKTEALPMEQLADMPFVAAEPVDNAALGASELSQIIAPHPQPKTMRELLSDKLANYSLTATDLTNFLDLTKERMPTFIEDTLVGFPEPVSEPLANGTALHAALELAQIQTSNNAFDLAAIKRLYEYELSKQDLTAVAAQRLTQKAHKLLDTLLGKDGISFRADSKPEQKYSAITASGLSMYGKIDRIDMVDDHTIRVVDYKSGKTIDNPASKAQPVLLKQWQHRLQLGFYILLTQQQKQFASKQIQAQIIQVEASDTNHLYLDYSFDEAELARIEQLALAVFKRIKTLKIPDVSAYEPTLTGIQNFEQDLLDNKI